MTLNQLECFAVLAQRLSFTQAAEDLFISQPALSRMISALEQELDIQLFYRSSRSVSLTPAGRAFAQECPRILDSYRASVDAALLAPTAMNQQKFTLTLENGKVRAKAGTGFYTRIDLGIVKYHFEAGAGKENFQWE